MDHDLFEGWKKMTTLNDYIVQNAGLHNGNAFLRTFGAAEVFFSIESPDENLKDGPLLASPGVDLKMQIARLEFGPVAVFYTSNKDARLLDRFGGIPLIRAAEMVVSMPDVAGMLIQSDQDAWFVVDRNALRQVAGSVRSPGFGG